MNKRKWFFALLLALPLVLAIPLYFAASWRPQTFGTHPFQSNARSAFAIRAVSFAPQYRLMMAPDGARLLSISEAGVVGPARGLAMWDVGRRRVIWKKTQGSVLDWVPLCFSPDSKTLVMAHNPGPHCCTSFIGPGLALFDAETGVQSVALNLKQFAYTFQDAAFSPDGKQLVTATNNGVQNWDVKAKSVVSQSKASALVGAPDLGYRPRIAFSRSGQRVVLNWGNWNSKSKGSQIHTAMHDLETGANWKIRGLAPVYPSFSPQGHWLLLSDRYSAQFEVREAANGRLMWRKSLAAAQPQRGAWLSDGSAALMDVGREFQVLDARTGKMLRAVPHNALQNFVITPDGNQIYYVNAQGEIWRQRLR